MVDPRIEQAESREAAGTVLEERMRFPGTFAFVGSGCLLVLELVAGRIVAPAIGVSLYTWTSVIGVVLGGISLGNYLGGRLADTRPGRSTLSTLYLMSAAASALVLLLARDPNKIALSSSFPAIAQVLWLVGIMFFLPSTLLGTITPMLVKLSLQELRATGRVVGRIQAAATLGSIIGTFFTGFYLISWFGTRAIVAGVAGAVLLLGILCRPAWGWTRILSAALVATMLAIAIAASQGTCLRESNYYCIRVVPVSIRDLRVTERAQPGVVRLPRERPADVRALLLDRLVHGFIDMQHPTELIYGYELLYERVLRALHPFGSRVDGLFLGGGAYSFPRFLRARYRGRILVAEIDPAVTHVAEQYLGLRLSSRLQVRHQDARVVLRDMPAREEFDAVFGDAFSDYSVPFHLATQQFDQLVAAHLRPGGVYLMNVVDAVHYDFLRSLVRTLESTFHSVRVLTVTDVWPPDGSRQTFVLAAGNGPLPTVPGMVSPGRIRAFEAHGTSVLLTDDHVPVDQLLAPVFKQRLEQR